MGDRLAEGLTNIQKEGRKGLLENLSYFQNGMGKTLLAFDVAKGKDRQSAKKNSLALYEEACDT